MRGLKKSSAQIPRSIQMVLLNLKIIKLIKLGFPKNIERMFETFHQTPTGEFKPTFYNPFEIKHRRRTSKDQFQVLEASFQENCKPNAAIRRALASKLGMTPRAVQVWFQNRRAKMKLSGTPGSNGFHSVEVPDSPIIGSSNGSGSSTNCSSLASPEGIAAAIQKSSIQPPPSSSSSSKAMCKKGLGRRHSMPNMIPVTPSISNDHFKQLHEAIFGGTALSPHLNASSMNYQVPMKPGYEQASVYPQAYYSSQIMGMGYAPAIPQSPQISCHKSRATSIAFTNPMMTAIDQSSTAHHHHHQHALDVDPTSQAQLNPNDLDFFLQSVIFPQGSTSAAQQQIFLSSLMTQHDPTQLPGITENLTNFLTGSNSASGNSSSQPLMEHGHQQSDSYLLSKYMNDERFAD